MNNAIVVSIRRASAGGLLVCLALPAFGTDAGEARGSGLDACRGAGTTLATCLDGAIESEEARIRELLDGLVEDLPVEEASALRESTARFEEFLARECEGDLPGAGDIEPDRGVRVCRLEYLLARRHLLDSLFGDPSVGPAAIAGTETERGRRPSDTEIGLEEPPPDPRAPEAPPRESSPKAPRVDSPVRAMSAVSETRGESRPVEMTAPMVLEVDVPVLESLRRGYGWPTSETERFVAEGVRVRRLVVEKRTRRGAVEILVTAVVYSERYLHRARVELELLSPSGDPVASADTGWIQVGRGVPSQQGEGLEKELRFALTPEAYQSLVAPEDPPRIRVTMDVGGE